MYRVVIRPFTVGKYTVAFKQYLHHSGQWANDASSGATFHTRASAELVANKARNWLLDEIKPFLEIEDC